MNTQMNQVKAQTRTAEMHHAADQARLAASLRERPSISWRMRTLVPSGFSTSLKRIVAIKGVTGARRASVR